MIFLKYDQLSVWYETNFPFSSLDITRLEYPVDTGHKLNVSNWRDFKDIFLKFIRFFKLMLLSVTIGAVFYAWDNTSIHMPPEK